MIIVRDNRGTCSITPRSRAERRPLKPDETGRNAMKQTAIPCPIRAP